MRNLILFDDKNVWTDLLPITYTRPLADIRIGIMTIRQKWQMRFPDTVVSALTMPYLSKKYPTTDADSSPGTYFPTTRWRKPSATCLWGRP